MSRTDETTPNAVQDLVREGWQHLQLQRPQAAWASWQRALRLDPGDVAAREALDGLEAAAELPASARAVYRFQTPSDPTLRARWDARLRGGGLDDLDAAAEVFAALTNENPSDADAWLNLALCRAWLGQNAEAITCLDRVVSLLAADEPGRAADAWTVAEFLRPGAGAEALADDFRYAWVVDARRASHRTLSRAKGESGGVSFCEAGTVSEPPSIPPPRGGRTEKLDALRNPALPDDLAGLWPNLYPQEILDGPDDDVRVFEWLDRPPAVSGSTPDHARDLPRVLATVIQTTRLLRISSPDPAGFEVLGEAAAAPLVRLLADARREKSPLPIAWADAALGTFKMPQGVDEDARAALGRSVVEHYYEDIWVHQPRQALAGLSPLEAGRLAARGDVVAGAKLAAVVRYREQLGSRTTHAVVYQGYPFDRLRRRVGIVPDGGSAAVDSDDVSCMSGRELDEIDPSTLEGPRLVDAFFSAAALADDARTARFAAALIGRDVSARSGVDPSSIFAPLVRESLRLGDPEQALAWLETARAGATGPLHRTITTWTAEIYARSGRPEEALRTYRELLDRPEADAALALDAAETMLDNGYSEQALPLTLEAQARARVSGDRETLRKAEILLGRG